MEKKEKIVALFGVSSLLDPVAQEVSRLLARPGVRVLDVGLSVFGPLTTGARYGAWLGCKLDADGFIVIFDERIDAVAGLLAAVYLCKVQVNRKPIIALVSPSVRQDFQNVLDALAIDEREVSIADNTKAAVQLVCAGLVIGT